MSRIVVAHERRETLQDDLISTVKVRICAHHEKYRRHNGSNRNGFHAYALHECEVGKVEDSLSSQGKSPLEPKNARNEFESLWWRYVNWRCECARDSRSVPLRRTHPSVCVSEGARPFALLNELEAHARAVLRTRYSSDIPQAFVMALIETAADTTARFMLANASCDERYCGLGFEMLWNGLSAIQAPGEKSKYEQREDAANTPPRFQKVRV